VPRDVLEGRIIGPVTLSLVPSIISGRQIPHYFASQCSGKLRLQF
jgi:hypothetical protein